MSHAPFLDIDASVDEVGVDSLCSQVAGGKPLSAVIIIIIIITRLEVGSMPLCCT
jgi:hypothetical protein